MKSGSNIINLEEKFKFSLKIKLYSWKMVKLVQLLKVNSFFSLSNEDYSSLWTLILDKIQWWWGWSQLQKSDFNAFHFQLLSVSELCIINDAKRNVIKKIISVRTTYFFLGISTMSYLTRKINQNSCIEQANHYQ